MMKRLNRKLVLEARTVVPDGGGGVVGGWQGLGSHWASLAPVSAREVVAGGRPVSQVTHKVTVRAAPPGSPRRPQADQRFRMGGRIFAIKGVAEADEGGAFLVCWVEEGVPT
jgi:SPP1 family predicted phage head-tail adaptor